MKRFLLMLVFLFSWTSFLFAEENDDGVYHRKTLPSFVNTAERTSGAIRSVLTGKKIPVVSEKVLPEPVAEYLFSGNAHDTSKNVNHAIVTGALPTEDRAGKNDSAYIFYERSHHIEIPLTDKNAFSNGSFTASFWIKTKAGNDGSFMELLTNKAGTTPSWGFYLTSQGTVYFGLKDQEVQSAFITSPPVNDGNWHQITGIRRSEDNTIRLYVDGAWIQTRVGVSGTVNSGGSIWVGDHTNLMFTGRIDDIRLWDQALNEAELSFLHSSKTDAPTPANPSFSMQSPGIPEPVGRYMFDGNADDSSGNQNHGIVTGAELIEDRAGNVERAYLFYQRPHCIKIPLTPKNTFGPGSFTASFWVKTKDENGGPLKGLLTNDSGSKPMWGFKTTQDGKVIFMLRNQEGESSSISYPINDGKWHHVTGTRNAENRMMSLYVDSTLVQTRPSVSGSVNSLGDIWIGDHQNLLFSGRIDDVMLWDKAFSEKKMADFHLQTATIPLTAPLSPDADNRQDPVGIYHFNGNAQDESPENNDGRVTAAYPSSDRYGAENSAYCFADRNNHIEIPLIPANTFTRGSFSVSFWVKINEAAIGASMGLVTNSNNTTPHWGFYQNANQAIYFVIRDKENQHAIISQPFELGKWHHIVGVRNAGAGNAALYVDSRLVNTVTGVNGDVNSGNSIRIGEHTNLLFCGCIDDVVFWRRALRPQEINEMDRRKMQNSIPESLLKGKVFRNERLGKPDQFEKW